MNIFQLLLTWVIRVYQVAISPVVAAFFGASARCRFTPTCSQYALEAIRLHGAFAGCWLALRRLARCHPWGACGDDSVPQPVTHKSGICHGP
jgi:putative membrane protein insertion efficiency factor